MKQHIKTLIFVIFFLFQPIGYYNGNAKVILKDNTDEDLLYSSLDGDWYFFQEQLLTPPDVRTKIKFKDFNEVSIPNSFEKLTGKKNSFGTFALEVSVPKKYIGETLAIHVPFQYSAYKLYVNNVEIAKNGYVGVNDQTHKSEMAPKIAYFKVESEQFLITMQVSSFEHIRGGFENSIYIGDSSTVNQKFNMKMTFSLFINGCIFIIGLFMILFSYFRKKEVNFLLFGLFIVLISSRSLFAYPFYYTLLFNISWLWGTRLEYILTLASSMLYVIVFWKWYENIINKKIVQCLVAMHLLLIAITFVTQPVFFQKMFFTIFSFAIPFFIYMIYIIIKGLKQKNYYSKANLIGLIIIFLAFLNDFAIGQNWIQSITLTLPAVGFYVLMQVFNISKSYASSIQKTELQYQQLLSLNQYNENLADQLKEEIKRKNDFLANTSHELRNPLHGIINISQSILSNKNELDQKTKKEIELQLKIARHMSRTLEDLMDLTRLNENLIQLHKQAFNLQEVTIGVIDILKYLVGKKSIDFVIDIPDQFPLVYADYNRIIQVLYNLIHNAIKFTDEGYIKVRAEEKNGMAFIHIEDTGIGMSEETVKEIFTPYWQEDSSKTAKASGLGLGLNICKQLVEMHGGFISATSKLGDGTTFTFSLPLATSEMVESPNESINNTVSDIFSFDFKDTPPEYETAITEFFTKNKTSDYRAKILAVDDDPINLQVLKNILPENQYEIYTVTSAKEALDALNLKDWDLIISDVMMPSVSGYDLTRMVREKYSSSELPILLLTARSSQDDIYSGFLAGANDYITKPVDAVELNYRVQSLTKLKISIREKLSLEAAWLQAQLRPHFILNTLNSIISLSNFDIERMQALTIKFADYVKRSFYLKNLEKVVPLKYELELVESFLYIQKERFGDRINIVWDIDKVDIVNTMIPPLAIQTLVENSLNHGILKKIEGGTITIKIESNERTTDFSVIDDGVGMDEEIIKQIFTFDENAQEGIGLLNTNLRLKQLFGAELKIESEPNIGTTISFQLYNQKLKYYSETMEKEYIL